MRGISIIAAILLTVAFVSGCAKNERAAIRQEAHQEESQSEMSISGETEKIAEYRSITPKEAKEMMERESGFILLDVRSQAEFDEGYIAGASLIPNTEIAKRAETELPDKDALILVYCRSGRRSAIAANALIGLGYTNVYDLGGIINWPYDVVS